MSKSERVKEFHLHKRQPVRTVPAVPSNDEVRFRLRLIAEEFLETLAACFDVSVNDEDRRIHSTMWFEGACSDLRHLIDCGFLHVRMVPFVDGLEDMEYVIEGARKYFGVDGEPISQIVHRKNMEKIPAPDGGKAIKPPGWTPPDAEIRAELIRQGWQPPASE